VRGQDPPGRQSVNATVLEGRRAGGGSPERAEASRPAPASDGAASSGGRVHGPEARSRATLPVAQRSREFRNFRESAPKPQLAWMPTTSRIRRVIGDVDDMARKPHQFEDFGGRFRRARTFTTSVPGHPPKESWLRSIKHERHVDQLVELLVICLAGSTIPHHGQPGHSLASAAKRQKLSMFEKPRLANRRRFRLRRLIVFNQSTERGWLHAGAAGARNPEAKLRAAFRRLSARDAGLLAELGWGFRLVGQCPTPFKPRVQSRIAFVTHQLARGLNRLPRGRPRPQAPAGAAAMAGQQAAAVGLPWPQPPLPMLDAPQAPRRRGPAGPGRQFS